VRAFVVVAALAAVAVAVAVAAVVVGSSVHFHAPYTHATLSSAVAGFGF